MDERTKPKVEGRSSQGGGDGFFVTAMKNGADESLHESQDAVLDLSHDMVEQRADRSKQKAAVQAGSASSESSGVSSAEDSFQSDDSYYDEDEEFDISCLTKQQLG